HRNLARLRLGIDHRGISHDVLDARVTVVLRDPVTDLVEVDRRLLVAVRVLGHAKQLVLDRGKLIEPDELAVKGAALGEIGYPNPDTDPVVRAVLRTRSDHDLDRETTGIGNQSRAGAVSLVAELRLGKPSGLEALTHLPLVRVSPREEPDARALDAARQVILAVALLPSRQLDLSGADAGQDHLLRLGQLDRVERTQRQRFGVELDHFRGHVAREAAEHVHRILDEQVSGRARKLFRGEFAGLVRQVRCYAHQRAFGRGYRLRGDGKGEGGARRAQHDLKL